MPSPIALREFGAAFFLALTLIAVALVASACGGGSKPTLEDQATLEDPAQQDLTADEVAVAVEATAERAAAIDLTGPATVELADEPTSTLDSGMTVSAGVTDDRIRIGTVRPDPEDVTAVSIHTAMIAVFDSINSNGGIDGRTVELVSSEDVDLADMPGDGDDAVALVADPGDTITTLEVMDAFGTVPAAIVTTASWSGFSDPAIAPSVNSVRSSQCVEGMNGADLLWDNRDFGSIAIITTDGLDARDSGAGAQLSAESLGTNVALDGVGLADPTGANAADISEQIIAAGPDLVWLATPPEATAKILATTDGAGFRGEWGGPSWSWDASAMAIDGAEKPFDRRFTLTSPAPLITATMSGTAAGAAVVDLLREADADLMIRPETLLGWVIGSSVEQALTAASADGDLSRRAIADQLRSGELVYGDVTPRISWKIVNGAPTISRGSFVLDVVAERLGDATTISADQPTLGLKPVKGPFNSRLSTTWDFATCTPRG